MKKPRVCLRRQCISCCAACWAGSEARLHCISTVSWARPCSRGNAYSRRHVSLTPEQTAFWDFSWDEMARGDLPALVDYVLATTGQRQLAYVGACFAESASLDRCDQTCQPGLTCTVQMHPPHPYYGKPRRLEVL